MLVKAGGFVAGWRGEVGDWDGENDRNMEGEKRNTRMGLCVRLFGGQVGMADSEDRGTWMASSWLLKRRGYSSYI